MFAAFIIKRSLNTAGKEMRTVFTEMPAFIFGTSFFTGSLFFLFRHVLGLVFFGKKHSAILTDRFPRGITEYLFSADVPTDNLSIQIRNKDSVIFDAFD